MTDTPTLHSLHPLARDGGLTVRAGDKWWNAVRPGSRINLCVCTRDPETHTPDGEAEVTMTWIGFFESVPPQWLEREHEVEARTYEGLRASLERAYGAVPEDVTVVEYKRVPA